MSRTSKPRRFGGHGYVSKYFSDLEWAENKWMRQLVRQRLKDVEFGDSFDEKLLPCKKSFFSRWYYD